jgi:hypothetical protein
VLCLILGCLFATADHLPASLVSFICSYILGVYVMGGLTVRHFISTSLCVQVAHHSLTKMVCI